MSFSVSRYDNKFLGIKGRYMLLYISSKFVRMVILISCHRIISRDETQKNSSSERVGKPETNIRKIEYWDVRGCEEIIYGEWKTKSFSLIKICCSHDNKCNGRVTGKLPVSIKSNKVPSNVRMNFKMRICKDNKEFSFLHYKRMFHVNRDDITFFFDPMLAEDLI